MPESAFVDDLVSAVGHGHVREGDAELAAVNRDWTGRFTGSAALIVRPGDVDAVQGVVEACRRHAVPLVPIGGNSGLVGGTASPAGAVALSTARLTGITAVDDGQGQLTAGAGATLADVQRAARGAGWRYPVDFGARDSASVGGMVATNAGGVHVVRHGSTRRRLIGVEAVLGSGVMIRRLGGLVKDNTGYDLAGLLCGSEGTLGVVTAARLALAPDPPRRVTALVGFVDVASAVAAGWVVLRSLASVEAVELMLAEGVALVADHLDLAPDPVPGQAMVLIEAAGDDALDDRFARAVDGLDGQVGAAVGLDRRDRERLWRYRDGHTEAINARGPPVKLDVTIPGPALTRFLGEVGSAVVRVAPEATTWLFGHLGDGNVHVNVTGAGPEPVGVADAVLDLVLARGGSISAEHGIGRAKVDRLALDRGAGDIEAFRAIKSAWDPDGIMNPGALL